MEFCSLLYKKIRYFVLSTLLLVYSCAQVVAPTGGAKDVDPPKVVKSKPDSGSIRFNAKKIEITFNEFIQLKDLNTQLIISPPVDEKPEIEVKGKTLVIELVSPLKENTTYSISLGNAVKDLTEGNAIELKYVFSTGSVIDTLSITGKAMDGFGGKPVKGALVMLYQDFSDSLPYKKKPSYFAKPQQTERFALATFPPAATRPLP